MIIYKFQLAILMYQHHTGTLPHLFKAYFVTHVETHSYNTRHQLNYRYEVARTNRNRNRKLLISRAPTKAKSQEPAYSQALNQNKIDRQRSRSRESGRQTVRRLWWMVFGVETGR